MFKWAQQQLANVAGTQEPNYGPEAIRSVAEEAKTTPYTELKREDVKWVTIDSTCVETHVFYIMADNGTLVLAQVIYSNVVGIRTTCQFNVKIFYPDGSQPHLWCSTPLHHHNFSDDKTSFYADDCAVELSEDGTSYTIKSMNDERAIVNLKVTRTTPGFQAGKTGNTLYGKDLKDPWGSMRHAFWPRCVAEGTITTKEGPINITGPAFYAHALQGMKPHHAAASWNFIDYQGPKYSAVMMEFTTPPSYGSTVVNVGGIVKDGEIIFAGCTNTATHVKAQQDAQTGWSEPSRIKLTWSGVTKDGTKADAELEFDLEKTDRVDIMAEVPGFVKAIVATAAGTKPYVYQYVSQKQKPVLRLKIGEEEIVEEGQVFSEATFISGE